MIRAVPEAGALELLREAAATLEAAGVETSRLDAEWLLAAVLGSERFTPYLDPTREVSAANVARYRALVGRRARREPLQYLTGYEQFHDVRLAVTPDVLIPRPETEGLVQWALEVLEGAPSPVAADVGTGSGAIACALADHLPALAVVAIERSFAALGVASRNVRALALGDRVRLVAGDLLEPLCPRQVALDLVVANPPYLPTATLSALPPEVGFEPREALDGGPDGMAVLRRIIASAPAVLRRRGWLIMEIGEEQAGPLASLMAAEGFTGIQARRDLRGVERYIGGQWAEASCAAPARPC